MLMLPWTEILLRLSLAAVFGAAIGIERERKEWSAGMRTHMMVCVGSALMMLVSSFGFADTYGMEDITLDPSRVAAQIISGIGFIGAGTILFLKPATVLGLTTASGLWTVAGIGMATGGGMYFAAGATTVLALIILWGLHPLQKRLSAKFQQNNLTIITKTKVNPKTVIDRLLEEKSIHYTNFTVTKSNKQIMIELKVTRTNNPLLTQIVENLNDNPDVKKIYWTK
jgi:putative Mg2+ transporter-C (MgtC) family protein